VGSKYSLEMKVRGFQLMYMYSVMCVHCINYSGGSLVQTLDLFMLLRRRRW
jgi:hypothetical protein